MTLSQDSPLFSGYRASLDWFRSVLQAHNSPAFADAEAIYALFVTSGFDVRIALGQFAAESSYGTKGYAITTQSWGNQLYASWIVANCSDVKPYAPGNGYVYADFSSWTDSVRCGYIPLMKAYNASGYTTLYTMTAHWLGTTPGSARHLAYYNNIVAAANINDQIGVTEEVNPVTQNPGLLADVSPGATVYTDESRGTALITNWAGGTNVGFYAMPYAPASGTPAPLAPFRLARSSDPANPQLVVAYVGADHIGNIRPATYVPAPTPPADTTPFSQTDIDAAVAAQKAADDATCATSTQSAVDSAVSATKASAHVVVSFD